MQEVRGIGEGLDELIWGVFLAGVLKDEGAGRYLELDFEACEAAVFG
jgi:hypothetical protein